MLVSSAGGVAVATWEFMPENIAARRVARLDHVPIKACRRRGWNVRSPEMPITVGQNRTVADTRSSPNVYLTVFEM